MRQVRTSCLHAGNLHAKSFELTNNLALHSLITAALLQKMPSAHLSKRAPIPTTQCSKEQKELSSSHAQRSQTTHAWWLTCTI